MAKPKRLGLGRGHQGKYISPNYDLVTITKKSAWLMFQGCTPDFIADTCHGRCCWVIGDDGKPTTTIYVEADQQAELINRGARLTDNVLQTVGGKCGFQHPADGFCTIHNRRAAGEYVKPRSCYISPWILSKHNKLMIRNRYKQLKCGRISKVPAYLAFYSGLVMLFGDSGANGISEHFTKGGGDLVLPLHVERIALVKRVMGLWHNHVQGEEIKYNVSTSDNAQG